MKKYIELTIKGQSKDIDSYVEKLKVYSSDAFYFSEVHEDDITHEGTFIELIAKRAVDYKARVILFRKNNELLLSNIIPKTVSFLEVEQYNSVLRHFYEDVITRTHIDSLEIEITKEENAMQDLISNTAYNALLRWESFCDKNAPTTHPNDRGRWMNFICELYINHDKLSLTDFRNWLIEDKGWYYDSNDKEKNIFINLELDIEFGLDIIKSYAEKTNIR